MPKITIEFVDYGVQGEYGFFGKRVARLDVSGLTVEQERAEVARMRRLLGEHVQAVEVEEVPALS